MHGAREPAHRLLLGSTGSIGTQAVDVIARNPDRFDVVGLRAGGGDVALLARQARELGVSTVARSPIPRAEAPLRDALAGRASRCSSAPTRRPSSPGAAPTSCSTASRARSGCGPTLAALRAGSTLALANKESLVVGGALVHAARQRPDQIVPVDSEHSAIAQALRGGTRAEVATPGPHGVGRPVPRLVATTTSRPSPRSRRSRTRRGRWAPS